MGAVPAVTPDTIPVAAPTVANALEVLQVPPARLSDKVVVPFIQTAVIPVIAVGVGLTVTVMTAAGQAETE